MGDSAGIAGTVTRCVCGSSAACVWLAVLLASGTGVATELENWRSARLSALDELSLVRSSPSGMFWDNLTAHDSLLVAAGLWPDPVWDSVDHWHAELSLRGLTSSEQFVDGRFAAGRLEFTNDIRYRRLFIRHTLDVDSRYKQDPSFVWKTDRVAAGRIEEAYLQLDLKHAFLRLGRAKRSWGPFADGSLLLSSVAHTYDAFEWQVHGSFFEFRHLFSVLDYQYSHIDTDASQQQRYLSAHALNVMLGDWLTLGIFESVVFARDGLPDLQYVNPFGIYTVVNTNAEGSGNLMLGAQWRVHPFTKKVEILGQVLLDDIQVDNETAGDQEPSHWGIDAAVRWQDPLPLPLRHALRLRYTYLSRWLYLVSPVNTTEGERYTFLGQSFGWPYNDGDRWDLGVSVAGRSRWTARGGAVYQRNGSNTVTSPWNSGDSANPDAGYNGYRTETSLRSDTAQHAFEVYVEASAGWRGYVDAGIRVAGRWVKNAENVRTDEYEFEPVVAAYLSVQYPKLFVRPPSGRRARGSAGERINDE